MGIAKTFSVEMFFTDSEIIKKIEIEKVRSLRYDLVNPVKFEATKVHLKISLYYTPEAEVKCNESQKHALSK